MSPSGPIKKSPFGFARDRDAISFSQLLSGEGGSKIGILVRNQIERALQQNRIRAVIARTSPLVRYQAVRALLAIGAPQALDLTNADPKLPADIVLS